MNITICTIKMWNINLANQFIDKYSSKHTIKLITDKCELSIKMLENFKPDYIFFPHWSYIIPADIYLNFRCVVFHMTDLPFGRGGSPLQNLISRGLYNTKISAIKVSEGLDTGPIYLKKDFDISHGTADEIFTDVSKIIFDEMIPFIIDNNPLPVEQTGTPVVFKRRTPDQSEIKKNFSLVQIYDYIRMLDGEGYPNAYLDYGKYRLLFSKPILDGKEKIKTTVEIVERRENEY